MLEAAVALFGLFVSLNICQIYGPYMQKYTDHTSERKGSSTALWVSGFVALYCLVRLIHWAWITPFPLVGKP